MATALSPTTSFERCHCHDDTVPLPGEIGSRDTACPPGDDGMEFMQQSRKGDLGVPATAQHPREPPADRTQ
jgi:hypothetical protein